MSVVVLGYVHHCEQCGQPAMLTEQSPGWVCPLCSGRPLEPADELIWTRASVLLRGLVEEVQQHRSRDVSAPGPDGYPQAGTGDPAALPGARNAEETSPPQQTDSGQE